jgi:hypothetical protein
VLARRALGLLDLAAGRVEEALEHFRWWDRGGESRVHPGIVLYNVPELVEAAVRANRPEGQPGRPPGDGSRAR